MLVEWNGPTEHYILPSKSYRIAVNNFTSMEQSRSPVTVSIPYTPTAEELAHPDRITVWYIDGSGAVTPVYSGRYDPKSGMVIFTTTHFSRYAVAYVQKTFNDLGRHAWAKEQIETLAAKGILNGGRSFAKTRGRPLAYAGNSLFVP